jgi:hypothetical protein
MRVSESEKNARKVTEVRLGGLSSVQPSEGRSDTNPAAQDATDATEVLSRTVGPFRFTSKQSYYKSGGLFGGWEASCPYHRKNNQTGCRKWFGISGPTFAERRSAAAAAMLWCSKAKLFDRQRLHLAYQPDYNSAPDAAQMRMLPIFKEARPKSCPTDEDLDSLPKSASDLDVDCMTLAAIAKSKPKARSKRGRVEEVEQAEAESVCTKSHDTARPTSQVPDKHRLRAPSETPQHPRPKRAPKPRAPARKKADSKELEKNDESAPSTTRPTDQRRQQQNSESGTSSSSSDGGSSNAGTCSSSDTESDESSSTSSSSSTASG